MFLGLFQVGSNRLRALIAGAPIAFECLGNDGRHVGRQLGIQAVGGSGLVMQNGFEHGRGRIASKRLNASRHLVKHAAKAEQVRAGIEFLSQRLFGRHVGDGAE